MESEDFKPTKVTPGQAPVAVHQAPEHKSYPPIAIIGLSLIVGVIGGLYGALDLAKRPIFQQWFGGSAGVVSTQNLILNEQSAITDVVAKSGKGVVSIVVSKDVGQMRNFGFDPFGFFSQQESAPGSPNVQQVGAGTGFFVSADGLILTNRHVVSDTTANYTVITNEGQTYEATVLSRDPLNDLAILKVDIKNAPFLEFADSNSLQLGQHVVAIGNSLGQYQNTVTSGIISGVGRSITAGGGGEVEQLEGVIQTDAAINPGNSGGPLLNLVGQVIGINTAIDAGAQSVGFAIPANDAKAVLESYQRSGAITRPYVGVRYVMLNKAMANAQGLPKDYGALLLRGNRTTDFAVLPGSPADKAGLVENDILLEINGERLTEDNSLARVLKKYKSGDVISVKVYSKDQEKTVSITIGETK